LGPHASEGKAFAIGRGEWAVYRVLHATPAEVAAVEAAGFPCVWWDDTEDPWAPREVPALGGVTEVLGPHASGEVDAAVEALLADLRAADPALPDLATLAQMLEDAEGAPGFTLPGPAVRVTLRNTQHQTQAVVVCPHGLPHTLSRRQYVRAVTRLCGREFCRCGGVAGPQEVAVELVFPPGCDPTWRLA